MAMRQLRVYLGPETEPASRQSLADLPRPGTDFADDEIVLSADLHDVLQAYRNFRRPGA
jgi:hypothetical protein